MAAPTNDDDAPTTTRLSGAPMVGTPEKRRQVLDGARAIFLAQGYDGASVGDIAKAAGVSKGTIYVYFQSKEELFLELVAEEKKDRAERFELLDGTRTDVAAALTELGLDFATRSIRPSSIALLRVIIGAAEKFPHIGRSFFETGPLQGVARLKMFLDAHVAAGRLSIADTHYAATQFLDLCMTGLLKPLLFNAAPVPDAAQVHRTVDAAVRMFMTVYGVKARA
jgi:AcrR family transcriptional regulator